MDFALRTPKDAGAVIRARRQALGWDQAALAERTGASRLWVNQIEGGKPGTRLGLVLRAFDVLWLTLSASAPGEAGAEAPPPVRSVDLDAIVRAARETPGS